MKELGQEQKQAQVQEWTPDAKREQEQVLEQERDKAVALGSGGNTVFGKRLYKKLEPAFYDREILALYRRFRRSVLRALSYLESRSARGLDFAQRAAAYIERLVQLFEQELESVKEQEDFFAKEGAMDIVWPEEMHPGEIAVVTTLQGRFVYVMQLVDRLFALQKYASLAGMISLRRGALWRRRLHNRLVDMCAQILSLAHQARIENGIR